MELVMVKELGQIKVWDIMVRSLIIKETGIRATAPVIMARAQARATETALVLEQAREFQF